MECKYSTYSLGKISQREVPTQVDSEVKLKERERFQKRKNGARTWILVGLTGRFPFVTFEQT